MSCCTCGPPWVLMYIHHLTCRRECDARVVAEVTRQVEAFKQVELGGVRLEEQARSRRAAEAERAHMDAATKEAAARYAAAVSSLSCGDACLQSCPLHD